MALSGLSKAAATRLVSDLLAQLPVESIGTAELRRLADLAHVITNLAAADRIDPEVIAKLRGKYRRQIGRRPAADRPSLRGEVDRALAQLLEAGEPTAVAGYRNRISRRVGRSGLLLTGGDFGFMSDFSFVGGGLGSVDGGDVDWEATSPGSGDRRALIALPDGEQMFVTHIQGRSAGNDKLDAQLRNILAEIYLPKTPATPKDSTEAVDAPADESAGPPAERYFAPEIDPEPTEGLVVGRAYTLALSVKVGSSPTGYPPVPEESLFSPLSDEQDTTVTVQLDSDDCDIPGSNTQPLVVPRTGPSADRARFAVVPRHEGNCQLTATIHSVGRLIQKLDVALVVGAGTVQQPEVRAAVAPLPRLASRTTQRGIGLHLERTVKGFKCTAYQAVCSVAYLDVDLVALDAIVTRLRAALLRLVTDTTDDTGQAVFQVRGTIPAVATRQALAELAPLGWDLFRAVFYGPPSNPVGCDIGHWLQRAAFSPDQPRLVSITSDMIFLPWALMYVGDDPSNPNWDGFLGMRHIVEHLPLSNSGAAVSSTEISQEPALRVSLNLNTKIDTDWKTNVVANQRKYWNRVSKTRPWVQVESRLTGKEFLGAMSDGGTLDQIVYLYCHAATKGSAASAGESSIQFSDGRAITLTELKRKENGLAQLAGNPLVILNACESAQMSPSFYDGFSTYFFEKGCRGVIGTECKAPIYFAADWAEDFFKLFLRKQPVGLIVYRLRRQYLEKSGNPLGLLYGMYCNADTRLQ